MTDREPGFYWVKYCDMWRPAEYAEGEWELLGHVFCWFDFELDEIGPKIEPPHEIGYITVPTDPVPEVYAARIEPPDARPRRD